MVYFQKNQPSEASACFNKAIEVLNYSTEYFVLVNVLFNFSLLHYQIDDYNNSSYYIDVAIDKFNETDANKEKTLLSKCRILKSYLLISLGELVSAQEILQDSLAFFRQELEESCVSVMEIHYIFAKLYLHKNDLLHAESCATKAYNIMNKVDCSIEVRCHIRELLGEIYFYKKDYDKSMAFLKVSYSHGKNRNCFSDDILEWIEWAMKFCNDNLKKE